MEQAAGDEIAVIMVPFPAQSHLNQLLQLSCLIASSYPVISVHYVTSSIHIKQVKTRAHGFNPSHMAKILFHELPMADFESSQPPNPNSLNKSPIELFQPLLNASLSLREPFADYLRETSRKFRKVAIIHDFMVSAVVQDVASIGNAESYLFHAVSAFSMVASLFQRLGKTIPLEEFSKEPPALQDPQPESYGELIALQIEASKYSSGDLINTVRSLEAPFLDMFVREVNYGDRKIWPVGPLIRSRGQESIHECLKWLNKHEPDSVIFVCFGTAASVSDEQIRELALGLEQSGAKFLWILRDADKGNVFDGDARRIKLPQGFEERIEGVGLILRDWAPQIDILAHPSTGGYMTHCGWGSTLESLTMGVPLATWPMHSEHPGNAYRITEILKAGMVARDWAQRRELMKASVIAEVVRRLMASKEGDVVRERAQEIGSTLRRATEEGGESKLEMDSFVAHISRN